MSEFPPGDTITTYLSPIVSRSRILLATGERKNRWLDGFFFSIHSLTWSHRPLWCNRRQELEGSESCNTDPVIVVTTSVQ